MDLRRGKCTYVLYVFQAMRPHHRLVIEISRSGTPYLTPTNESSDGGIDNKLGICQTSRSGTPYLTPTNELSDAGIDNKLEICQTSRSGTPYLTPTNELIDNKIGIGICQVRST
jgi:hypothetical protein